MSEGLGSLLLIGLVIFAGVFLVRMLMSRRETAKPLQYAGAVGRDGVRPGYENQSRPVWSDTPKIEPRAAPAADAPGLGVTRKTLPEGFDAEGFVSEAKRQFIRLQGSYDTGDRAALSAVMTSEMYTEIARELDERGPHQATEIVKLDAEVLDLGGDAVLVAAEIDDAQVVLVAAALVARGDAAVVVAAATPALRLEERPVRLALVQLG